MPYGIKDAKMIDVDRVFLDKNNPRHKKFEDEDEIIEYLCHHEQILPLAKDIAENGLNLLELFALISDRANTFIVAEGNRRLCALKLLNDPDRAPANLRKQFAKVATNWKPIKKLLSMVLKDQKEVKLWLKRIHSGSEGGIGRKQWNAEQKARHSGTTKNALAQVILDIGQEREYISEEDRKGKLSIAQRYLSNPQMRDALGLDSTDLENILTDLPDSDFDILLRKFLYDLASREITTRDNRSNFIAYANELTNVDEVSGKRVDKHPIKTTTGKPKQEKPTKPEKPKPPKTIAHNNQLETELKRISNYKIKKLYYSLCYINLSNHTPLLSVGVWSFLETLTAICGRKPNVNFYDYLTNGKLSELGLGTKKETKVIREAVKRISEFGNTTKHHKISATFNGEQLANDFHTMEEMLIKLAEQAKGGT